MPEIPDHTVPRPSVNLDTLRHHVEILQGIAAKKSTLKKLEDNAKAAIRSALGDNDIGLVDGKPVVKIVRYKKNQFNQKALGAAHPEIVAEFTDLVEASRMDLITEDGD